MILWCFGLGHKEVLNCDPKPVESLEDDSRDRPCEIAKRAKGRRENFFSTLCYQ
jgi:hypothetical protein